MSAPIIFFGDKTKILSAKKIIEDLTFEDTLAIDTSGATVPAFTVKAKNNEALIKLISEGGTNVYQQKFDGFQIIVEYGSSIYHQVLANNYQIQTTAGGAIRLSGINIDGDASLLEHKSIRMGDVTYADAVNTLTDQQISMKVHAWNGVDGYSVSTTSRMITKQLSATNDDGRIDVELPAGTPVTSITPGKLGINETAPDEALHVVGSIKMEDGNEGLGKVLTSDANGVGSWQTTSADPNLLTPVGSIVAYNPGYYTDGVNGGFTVTGPALNDEASVNAFLPSHWRVCDGAALNDAASPIWNAAGRHLPNLTGNRFLLGFSASGVAGGSNSTTLVEANLPSHSHTINHDHAVQTSTINSVNHSHTIDHDHAAFNSANNSNSHNHSTPGGVGADSIASFNGTSTNTSLAAGTTYGFRYGNAGQNGLISGGVNSNHVHSINVPAFAGTSGVNSVNHTHNLDLPSYSGSSGLTGSGTSFSTIPQYLSTFFIVRVK